MNASRWERPRGERQRPGWSFDLQLTRYDEKGWRATFYTTGMKHSPERDGYRTPWRATQRAAWEALRRVDSDA